MSTHIFKFDEKTLCLDRDDAFLLLSIPPRNYHLETFKINISPRIVFLMEVDNVTKTNYYS